MEVADLLAASHQFEPCLLYYPAAVFEQNHEGCQNAPHKAFIWTGQTFISKDQYLNGTNNNQALTWSNKQSFISKALIKAAIPELKQLHNMQKKTLEQKIHFGIYSRLQSIYSFLPKPETISTVIIRPLLSIIDIFILFYAILTLTIHKGLSFFKKKQPAPIRETFFQYMAQFQTQKGTPPKKSWLQRFFLSYFAHNFAFCPNLPAQKYERLSRLLKGPLAGLDEQKFFLLGLIDLFAKENPNLIVLPEENLFYNSQLVVYIAHKNKIPVAIVPFTIVNTLEWAESFYNIPSYQVKGLLKPLLSQAFPHWSLMHRGRKLMLPILYILSCEYLHITPKNPWLINSGQADVLAAESAFMADYYCRAGIAKTKIHYTGSLADDKIYALLLRREYYRGALKKRYHFVLHDKVVLIGLPPDQFSAGNRTEFRQYQDLIQFMVETITLYSDITVLINVHPRTDVQTVLWLETLGAKIIQEPIDTLVPLADLYIAVASATIRLGILSGIPVINYDAYHYQYDDYQGLAGVCTVSTKKDYLTLVEKMLRDPLFYAEIKNEQQQTKDKQCPLDGQAGKRLLALFDSLTRQKHTVPI